MKKALSLVLALSLLLALSLPAAAEEGAEARLSAVTLAVKETLDLDTEAYSDFSGYPEENALSPHWYLEWYGDGGSLSVTAGEDGRILSYFRHDDTEYWDRGFRNPSFPEGGTGPKRPLRPSWTSFWPPMRPWCSRRTAGNP